MLIPDVNVLIAARRIDHPDHEVAHRWLEATTAGPLGLPDFVLASTLRLLTNPRVFVTPEPAPAAIAYVRALVAAPGAHVLHGGTSDWTRFLDLVEALSLVANDIPDALLAATALGLHATLITFDQGFRKYPGLRWAPPGS
ncbi:MAG: TA system VapC family ribonuclease toxin [Solirubrobacteraceae bacterium]